MNNRQFAEANFAESINQFLHSSKACPASVPSLNLKLRPAFDLTILAHS